jgi:hypothetical protein
MKLLVAFMKKKQFPYDTAENGLIALESYKANPEKYGFILMGK